MTPTMMPNIMTLPTTASVAFLFSTSGSTFGGAGPPSLIIFDLFAKLSEMSSKLITVQHAVMKNTVIKRKS